MKGNCRKCKTRVDTEKCIKVILSIGVRHKRLIDQIVTVLYFY